MSSTTETKSRKTAVTLHTRRGEGGVSHIQGSMRSVRLHMAVGDCKGTMIRLHMAVGDCKGTMRAQDIIGLVPAANFL